MPHTTSISYSAKLYIIEGSRAFQILPQFYSWKRGKIALDLPDLEILFEAHFENFLAYFGNCFISKAMFRDKN